MNQHTKCLGQRSFCSKGVARKDKHEPDRDRVLCQWFTGSQRFLPHAPFYRISESRSSFPRSSDSKDTVQTIRSTGTLHTSAKARLTSVAMRIRIRIRIPDPDLHQNLTICSLAHCQPSLKISRKSARKLLRKVANKRTDKQTNNEENNLLGGGNNTTTVYCETSYHSRLKSAMQIVSLIRCRRFGIGTMLTIEGGAVMQWVRHLGLRSVGRGFKSCSRQRCVTTLGKLFTPMCRCHQAV